MSTRNTRREFLQNSIATAIGTTLIGTSFADDIDYIAAVTGRAIPGASIFDAESTADDVLAGVDLTGKTALLTGCNSGIGYETMRAMTARGAHVIGAARTLEKAEKACASVDGETTPLMIELTDLDAVVQAAANVASMNIPLDMLILNAGIMALPEREVVNSVEKQFAVNHLGHFLLTEKLIDSVVAAKHGRVVVVSSMAHVWAPEEGIQFENLDAEVGYEPFKAYGQSKLANGLFSRELARRLADTNATSNSLHPGVIKTNLGRHLPETEDGGSDDDSTSSFTWKTIPQGAATSCYVAAHPDVAEITGYYFSDCNPAQPNALMQDDAIAEKLWTVSEQLTAEYRS